MRERPNRMVSKTIVAQVTLGSNPSPSAIAAAPGRGCVDRCPPRSGRAQRRDPLVSPSVVKLRDGWALALGALLAIARGSADFASPDSFDGIVAARAARARNGSGRRSAASSSSCSPPAWCGRGLAHGRPPWPRCSSCSCSRPTCRWRSDWASRPASEFAVALLRLPLQIPLIWWACHVGTRATLAPARGRDTIAAFSDHSARCRRVAQRADAVVSSASGLPNETNASSPASSGSWVRDRRGA